MKVFDFQLKITYSFLSKQNINEIIKKKIDSVLVYTPSNDISYVYFITIIMVP